MSPLFRQTPSAAGAMREQVPLAPLTTLGMGGPARWYTPAATEAEVRRAIAWARERALPWMVLGGGSNLLVSEAGFPGVVVHLQGPRALHSTVERTAVCKVAAAMAWDALVARSVSCGWAGLECLSGIPGRVGATPIQNVGAYGQEVRDVIVEVRAYDSADGRDVVFTNPECRFRYRDSYFKSEAPGRYVVLEVTYELRPGGAPSVRYADLRKAFSGAERPTLQQVRDAVIAVRRKKSMVLDPGDPNARSVGSFFTNPVVAGEGLARVTDRARRAGLIGADEQPPHYPAEDGQVKLSAAWLIERAGFSRGFRMGRVALSQNHTLAIVNCGEGTATDVLRLMRAIQNRVRERFGVELVPEPVFVGF